MGVSRLETLDWRSCLSHILILIFRSESVTDRREFWSIVDDVILTDERKYTLGNSMMVERLAGSSAKKRQSLEMVAIAELTFVSGAKLLEAKLSPINALGCGGWLWPR